MIRQMEESIYKYDIDDKVIIFDYYDDTAVYSVDKISQIIIEKDRVIYRTENSDKNLSIKDIAIWTYAYEKEIKKTRKYVEPCLIY